jgi:hypothetical protein
VTAPTADKTIKLLLENLTKENPDYWSFRGSATREHAHAFIQYPAMMVPQMQAKLISIMKEAAPWIRKVYDPYLGSGTYYRMYSQGLISGETILTVSNTYLSIENGPFLPLYFKKKQYDLNENIESDKEATIDVSFDNRDKWFSGVVALELSN